MHPILFHIGSFPVGTYGVLVALSVVAALGLARILAPGAGLDPERLVDLFVYSLLGAFVGAKLALILGSLGAFSAHPWRFVVDNLRSSGSFFGGFIAAVAVAAFYLHRHRMPFWSSADVAAICLALGQGMGRWGCFFAGCCYGSPTNLPWGMVFPAVPLCAGGVRIHPWPIYASMADLAIFAVLLLLFRRRSYTGQVFLWYVMLYSVARGLLGFLRGDVTHGLYFGGAVSLSQIVAVAAFAAALGTLMVRRRRAGG